MNDLKSKLLLHGTAGVLVAMSSLASAIEVYQAKTIEKYEAKTVQPVQSQAVQQYRAPTVQKYRAPTTRANSGSQVQAYQGGQVQQYRGGGQVQQYNGGGQARLFTKADFDEMHRNDVAAGRTHESMSKGQTGAVTDSQKRVNQIANQQALDNRMNQSGTIGYNPFRNE